MVIVVDCGADVQTYATQFAQLTFPRPSTCPRCAAAGSLWGHGSYARQVCDHEQVFAIRIKRLLCTACQHTVSLLPSFCLPFRHYQTACIQRVLSLRFGADYSWRAIGQHFNPSDLPTQTTCREWVWAFATASERYLGHLLPQLARWQWAPGKLELALADMVAAPSRPQRLVAAVPHLVAWLHERGVGVGEGLRRWLALLWQWGNGARLGRLV